MNVEILTEAAQFLRKGIQEWNFHCSVLVSVDRLMGYTNLE
jgi:hypothetical protein